MATKPDWLTAIGSFIFLLIAGLCLIACLVYWLTLPTDADAERDKWVFQLWRIHATLAVMQCILIALGTAAIVGIHWVIRRQR